MPDKTMLLNKIRDLEISIKVGDQVYKRILPVGNERSEKLEYYAAHMTVGCTPYGDDSEGRYVVEEVWLGTASNLPWTPQEVATVLKNANTLNTLIFNTVKAVYKKAIDLDVN